MTEATLRGSDRIGTTIRGKYTIDRLLGEGGMAVVYAATHRNKKRFAVKMLHPELSLHQDIRRRFLKEGYLANTVDHPGAVAVLDDDVAEDGAAFLVMELLEGAPVDAIAVRNGGKLPLAATLVVAHALLDVLAAAHPKGVVHRDLKHANLFATKDGALKVLDFGIARIREAAQSSSSATSTGMMLGTPAFMPPEQAMAKSSDIDARTDLWAVGATMFNLLSGDYVHTGENATQIVIAAATQPARSLSSVMPSAPQAVVDLLARALAFERERRFQSARVMQDAVLRVHREVCGGEPSREMLVALAGGSAPASERAPVVLVAVDAVSQQDQVAKTLSRSQHPPKRVGGTTAQPVSVDPASVPAFAAGSTSTKARPAIIAALAVVLVGIGVAAGMQLKSRAPAVSSATSGAASPAVVSGLPVPPQSSLAASQPTAPAPAASAQEPAQVPPAASGIASAGPPPAAPSPPTRAPTTRPVQQPTPPAQPPPAPGPTCQAVQEFDSQGQPHFRKVCK